MTRLTIPTLYNADFKRPKKRTVESVTMLGSVEVLLREMEEADAPVVHVVGDTYRPVASDMLSEVRRYNPFPVGKDGPCPVRSVDGKLYARRWRMGDPDKTADLLAAGGALDVYYRDANGGVVMGMRKPTSEPEVYATRAEAEGAKGPFREWDDQYARTASAIQRRCEDMIVVDGWIYDIVGEPVLSVQPADGEVRIIIGQASRPVGPYMHGNDHGKTNDGIRFGIDQLPRALETAERLARAMDGKVANYAVIEMVSPWAVRFRGEREHMRQVALNTLTWGKGRLTSLPAPAGLAWHDLASALSDIDQVNPKVIEALRRIDSLRKVADDEVERFDSNGHARVLNYELSERERQDHLTLEGLSLALDLWDTRQNEGIEWVDRGLNASATFEGNYLAYEVLSLTQADRLALRMGRSLDDIASDAAAGKGHMIAVESASGIAAVAYVSRCESGFEVMGTVTSHGSKPPQAVLDIAVRHASEASAHLNDMDAALDDFGI